MEASHPASRGLLGAKVRMLGCGKLLCRLYRSLRVLIRALLKQCALHIHGYTERYDARATYSSPSAIGLMMAVGNVGTELAPYADSDTFFTRDGGFTWEEVHKDAHLSEFGDSGSILIMANDEEPVDHVLFSTDEGKTWREYKFGGDKIRVRYLVTVPSDTSRRFILFGNHQRDAGTVAVHIDFSALVHKKCRCAGSSGRFES